ncbi:MurR/RpiR family transcriptional regulator [Vibrio sp.]|nr:MurR/RpiR family transcriptional regulator [Vibrio sp.]
MNIIEKVQKNLDHFSKSEKKVADVVLTSPDHVIHLSIAAMAKLANVSEPTVNRFCRRVNTKGYPDFKLHLAQSLANGTSYVSRIVEENDDTNVFSHKIIDSTISNLESIKGQLDTQQINKTIDLLIQANRISFFGLGASSIVAKDAQSKFIRFNIPVVCFEDVLLQRMSCINAPDSDVLVLISNTGRTKSQVEIAHIARENGTTVVAITSKGTPLDNAADHSIHLTSTEDTDIYMPMASRIAQMTIIDILATGFTLKRGAGFRENLKKVKNVLQSSRYDKHSQF